MFRKGCGWLEMEALCRTRYRSHSSSSNAKQLERIYRVTRVRTTADVLTLPLIHVVYIWFSIVQGINVQRRKTAVADGALSTVEELHRYQFSLA